MGRKDGVGLNVVGKNLKEIRMARGESLTSVAAKADVAKSYLSNLENGIVNNPTIGMIKSMAEVLEVDMWEIFGGDTEKKKLLWQGFIEKLEAMGITEKDFPEMLLLAEFLQFQKSEGRNEYESKYRERGK